ERGGHVSYDLCCLVSACQFSPNCNFFRFGTKLKLSVMQYQIGTHDRDLNDDVSRSICMRYKRERIPKSAKRFLEKDARTNKWIEHFQWFNQNGKCSRDRERRNA